MSDAVTPFTLAVPQAELDDLNRRLDKTRWPDARPSTTGRRARPWPGAGALRPLAHRLRLAPRPRRG